MDILKPELHWMGSKRCYRVNPILADDESHLEKENKTTEYIENGKNEDFQFLFTWTTSCAAL